MRKKRSLDTRLKFKCESDSDLHITSRFINQFHAVVGDNSYESDLIDSLETIVSTSTSPESFRFRYLAREIFRKRKLTIDTDTVTPAIEKFLKTEEKCRMINNEGYDEPSGDLNINSIMFRAQQLVSRCLGDVNYVELGDSFDLSAGASRARTRKEGNPAFKFHESAEFCGSGVNLACIVAKQYWPEGKTLKLTRASRLTTVPKSSTIDRVINIEPEMNMFIQKGIGTVIRNRLKTVNININDQTINQQLAQHASKTNSLATIDLASASDSISTRLCFDLLPKPWLDLIMACRSNFTTLPDGKLIPLEKVASMGNGFCFELETLLFWALTKSVADYRDNSDTISVYGDDIICSSSIALDVIEILRCVGFDTNTDKTFYDSKFRESCGKHYYEGIDVTPFYVRTILNDLSDLILFCNNFRRWMSADLTLDPRFIHIYDQLLSNLPDYFSKMRIPDGYGNGACVGLRSDGCINGLSYQRGLITYPSLLARTKVSHLPPEGSLHYWLFKADMLDRQARARVRTPVLTSQLSRFVGSYRVGKISSLDFLL